MAKKPQNSNLATKTDLKHLEEKLGGKINGLEGKMNGLEKRIDGFEERVGEKLDKIANTLDGFVGRVDDLTIENQVGANQIKELRDKVNNHEERITKLESPSL